MLDDRTDAGSSSVNSESEQEGLLVQSDNTSEPKSLYAYRRPIYIAAVAIALVLTSSLLTVLTVWRYLVLDLDKTCSLYTTQSWSPILRDVEVKYEAVDFNGSFWKETKFRGEAGPEVDDAWEALGTNYKRLVIPVEDAEKSGIALDSVSVPAERPGGPGYHASVEVFHQLHCLNLLRKALYFNVDYYRHLGQGAFADSELIIRPHVTHCLDMLRQQLMCSADTVVFPYIWVEGLGPVPNFNRKHKCRNFDAIREWAEEKQAGIPFEIEPSTGTRVYSEYP